MTIICLQFWYNSHRSKSAGRLKIACNATDQIIGNSRLTNCNYFLTLVWYISFTRGNGGRVQYGIPHSTPVYPRRPGLSLCLQSPQAVARGVGSRGYGGAIVALRAATTGGCVGGAGYTGNMPPDAPPPPFPPLVYHETAPLNHFRCGWDNYPSVRRNVPSTRAGGQWRPPSRPDAAGITASHCLPPRTPGSWALLSLKECPRLVHLHPLVSELLRR